MFPNLLGEFLGTMTLVAFGDSVVANLVLKDTKGNGAGWVHVNWGWAFGLMMGIYVAWAYGAGEADLNPAVTIFKFLVGGHYDSIAQVIATIAAEVAGGVAGGVVVYLLYLNHWACTEDPGLKLAVFSTGAARRDYGANFLTEVIATFFLIMGIQAIVKCLGPAGSDANVVNLNLLPFMIGGLLYALGAGMGGTTGYGMNPARDMGPRIAHAILPIPGKGSSDWQWGFIVATAGPIVGGLLAVAAFKASGW
ncbi:major intrinsic protein [Synergistales bacterium]|nr:major intrinsic protein [Synergistales bacterium]GHV50733.1 major intrinsic protein [Synergistales bacterium]